MCALVFLSQDDAEDVPAEQFAETVFDVFGIPIVGEAFGERVNDVDARIDLAQQLYPAIGADASSVEVGLDFAPAKQFDWCLC